MVKDDITIYSWLHLFWRKSNAADTFRNKWTDVRADDVPSEVERVRSDNGGDIFGGDFGDVCRPYCIKQNFTNAQSPELNSVAERVCRSHAKPPIPFPTFNCRHRRHSGLNQYIGGAKL